MSVPDGISIESYRDMTRSVGNVQAQQLLLIVVAVQKIVVLEVAWQTLLGIPVTDIGKGTGERINLLY